MKVNGRAVLKVLDSFSSGFFPMGVPIQRSAFEENKSFTNIHVYLFVSVCTYLHRNGKTDMKRIVTIVQQVPG